MRDRFAIYVGRIDENKGCVELFDFFEHYSASLVDGMHLVLIGTPHMPIPKHPRIHHLGFLEDQDKYDAMAAAELLIMPSYLESLSMVALEAWAMGKPVLANAKCDVLQGQCMRSNAGLFYANYAEFAETLRAIDTTPSLQAALGRNGRAFFERHYAWPVIEKKYVDMLQQLSKESRPRRWSRPGWFGAAPIAAPPIVSSRAPPALSRDAKRVERDPRAVRAARSSRNQPRDLRQPRRQQPPGGATPRQREDARPARTTPRTPRSAAAARRPTSSSALTAQADSGKRRRPQGKRRRRSTRDQRRGRRSVRPQARGGGGGARSAPMPDERTSMTPAFIRCSRPLATATPSVTKCWASSACCATPATTRRSSSRRRTARRAPDAALFRSPGCEPSRQHPDSSLSRSARERRAGVRAARSHGARLPQHHAAGIFRRRQQGARRLCFRAGASWRSIDRDAISRSAIPNTTARSSTRSASAPTGVLPVVPGFDHLKAADSHRRCVRRRLGQHPVRRPRHPEQAVRGLIRAFTPTRTFFNPRSRLLLVGSHAGFDRYVMMLRGFIARLDVRDVHLWASLERGAGRVLRSRRRVRVGERARRLLRAR
jgi:hypothetical protein